MNNRTIFRPQILTTIVIGILALVGGFALANGPVARAAMEKAGLLQTVPAIPETFNYQGYLREADGSLTNGTQNITSKIYAVPTGGTAIHTENFANVNVRDGLFNVVIGDATPLGTTFNQAPLYIGISVDGTELIPRERIHGVPWAIRATTAGSATTADSATTAGSATTATTAGSATTAGTANEIVPGAINVTTFSVAATGAAAGSVPIGFPSVTSNTHACFLQANATPNLTGAGCALQGNLLIAGAFSACSATCIQWGQ